MKTGITAGALKYFIQIKLFEKIQTYLKILSRFVVPLRK